MATHTNGRSDAAVIAAAELLVAPAVEVSQPRKTYPGGVEAVKGIDFQVAPGEVFGLLGPNGAGKSTTIGMLTTTIAPTSGTAAMAGIVAAGVAAAGGLRWAPIIVAGALTAIGAALLGIGGLVWRLLDDGP